MNLLLVNQDFVQVPRTKVLVFGYHRGIERLAELAGGDARVTLNLHLSNGGIGFVELASARPL